MSENTTEQAAEEYYSKMGVPYMSMHRHLDNFSKLHGWKELFFIVLKFQKEKAADGAYKLISTVSNDHKRLVTRHVYLENQHNQLQFTITNMQQENEELNSKLSEATFEIETGVSIISELQQENERLKALVPEWVSVEAPPKHEDDILICRQDGFEDWQSIGNYIEGKFYNVWDF